jgi:hypothetical protein
MPLFLVLTIFNNHSYSTIIHSFIFHHSLRPVFLYPDRFSAVYSFRFRILVNDYNKEYMKG